VHGIMLQVYFLLAMAKHLDAKSPCSRKPILFVIIQATQLLFLFQIVLHIYAFGPLHFINYYKQVVSPLILITVENNKDISESNIGLVSLPINSIFL